MKKLMSAVLCLVVLFSCVCAVSAKGIKRQQATPPCMNGYHTDVRTNTYIAPTCTKNGFVGGKACVACGTVIENPVIIPATHENNGTVVAKGSGYVDKDGDGYCDICGNPEEPKIGIIDLLLDLFRYFFG